MSGQTTGWVHRSGPRPEDVDGEGRAYGPQRARALRSVMLIVADAANADGCHAHPGLEFICSATFYSRRQAQTLLGQLVDDGWLEVEEQGGGRGRATEFRVVVEHRETVQPPHPMVDGNGAVSDTERVQSEGQTVQLEAETVQSGLHPNGVTTGVATSENNDEQLVFETWVAAVGRSSTTTRFTPERRTKVRARLADYPLEDVLDAVRGIALSPFHMGDNDRKTAYNDLTFVCRNGSKLEEFRDLYRAGAAPRRAGPLGAVDEAFAAFDETGRAPGTTFGHVAGEETDAPES